VFRRVHLVDRTGLGSRGACDDPTPIPHHTHQSGARAARARCRFLPARSKTLSEGIEEEARRRGRVVATVAGSETTAAFGGGRSARRHILILLVLAVCILVVVVVVVGIDRLMNQ
jgi:hypothetical protein